MQRALFLATLCFAQPADDGTCLLTLKADRSSVAASTMAMSVTPMAALEKHNAWMQQHAKIKQAIRSSTMPILASPVISSDATDIQAFIDSQQKSSDACHAKIVEVRRTLDGIMAKVNQLSEEVEAHEAIIAGNTGVINENVDNRVDGNDLLQGTYESCEKEFNLAMAALQHYRLEIKEMEQIANPAVRSKISFGDKLQEETKYHSQQIHSAALRHAIREAHTEAAASAMAEGLEEEKRAEDETGVALLSTKSKVSKPVDITLLSNEQCVKLAKVLLKDLAGHRKKNETDVHEVTESANDDARAEHIDPHAQDHSTMAACNGTRAKLQETFDLSWHGLNTLLNDGEKLAEDEREECRLAAKNANEERQDQFDNQIKDATININAAQHALGQLNHLIENAFQEVKLLESHMQSLKTDCVIESGVTKELVAVRQLIHSLADCPGRNDFRLIIPSSETMRIGIGSNEHSWSNTIGVEGSQAARAEEAAAAEGAAAEEEEAEAAAEAQYSEVVETAEE